MRRLNCPIKLFASHTIVPLIISLVCLVGASPNAFAVEIYSFYQKNCQLSTGAIIHVNHDQITILLHDGKIKQIPIKAVETVVRYNAIETPFTKILTTQNQSFAWSVSSDHKNAFVFQGFAVGFWDNVVIFMDSQGATHVLEQDDIVSLHSVSVTAANQRIKPPSQSIQFQPPPNQMRCKEPMWQTAKATSHIRLVGNMIMADKFKIETFFRTMANGYLALNSLGERTRFYSRPLLFDSKTRLGILAPLVEDKRDKQVSPEGFASMPLYLEFGGGTPYRFQSHVGLGANSWRYTESIKDTGAFVSEFKSHILHGVFVANLDGFTAAQSVWGDRLSIERVEFPWVRQSLNHLTMLGIDVLNWSFSYGYYFPVLALGYQQEYREILASKPDPVFQVGYTNQNYQLKILTFINNTSANLSYKDREGLPESINNTGNIRYTSPPTRPKSVKISAYTLRINNTFDFYKNYHLELDGVYTSLQAKESAYQLTNSNPTDISQLPLIRNTYDYRSIALLATLRVDLGQWVALKGECQFEHQNIHFNFGSSLSNELSTEDVYQRLVARAVFELIL